MRTHAVRAHTHLCVNSNDINLAAVKYSMGDEDPRYAYKDV